MKKGADHPPDTLEYPDCPVPPYPGPSLDSNVVVNLPTPDGQPPPKPNIQHQILPAPQAVVQPYNQPAPQPLAELYNQPAPEPLAELYNQPAPQPVAELYNQPTSQPVAQLYNQSTPQPVAQLYNQPAPHPVAQRYQQPFDQQSTQPVNQVVVTQPRPTDTAVRMICPHCQNTVMTSMEYKIGLLTWIIVGVLFFSLLWPFCLVPFCVDSCKDVQHSCPSCNNVLHVHKQI